MPATAGLGAPVDDTALVLWPASVIPQSRTLLSDLLFEIRFCAVGPSSSVSRIPPALFCTVFDTTLECVTDIRCSASPQSPGTCPWGAHSPTSFLALRPRSLPC